ncbi:hypothetical protein CDAR_308501 [Caerostris darwini]|uniref:Uncharacterized protein n=1 Tax=Caerostris darwini TaxID=1538125 RepID=A0AAV4RYX4_9ARAC|nr:hypothetical protein CDAR_308501 [Caerostris darwini]
MAQAIIKTIHPNKVHLRPPKSTTIPLSHIQQPPIRSERGLPISIECSPASACLINNRNPWSAFYKSGFKGGNYCQRAANGGPSWGAWMGRGEENLSILEDPSK